MNINKYTATLETRYEYKQIYCYTRNMILNINKYAATLETRYE